MVRNTNSSLSLPGCAAGRGWLVYAPSLAMPAMIPLVWRCTEFGMPLPRCVKSVAPAQPRTCFLCKVFAAIHSQQCVLPWHQKRIEMLARTGLEYVACRSGNAARESS